MLHMAVGLLLPGLHSSGGCCCLSSSGCSAGPPLLHGRRLVGLGSHPVAQLLDLAQVQALKELCESQRLPCMPVMTRSHT